VQHNIIKYSKDKNKHSMKCKTQTEYVDRIGCKIDLKKSRDSRSLRLATPAITAANKARV